MPCQAAYGEVRPVEKRVQLLAVLCPVQGDERLQAVAADGRRDFFRFAPAARFAYQVEADFIFGMAAVILSQTSQQAVEAVPEVDFGNSYQVQLSGRAVPGERRGMRSKSIPLDMRMVGRPNMRSSSEKVTMKSTYLQKARRNSLSVYSCAFSLTEAYSWS